MSDHWVQWWGRHELLQRDSGASISVEKWRVRKNAALVRGGNTRKAIAYFTSEEAAKQFCEEFLGGVVYPEDR